MEDLYFKTRAEWRSWLEKNFETCTEGVWLIFPKKNSKKQRLPYNHAVEEALCFNWIDSTVKGVDDFTTKQRFTPRRKNSNFSELNKVRIRLLLEQNRVHKKFKTKLQNLIKKKFTYPKDIITKIKEDKETWKNFQNFSENYKLIRLAYIENARRVRPEEFKKRLENFLKNTKKGKIIGILDTKEYY